MNEKKKRRRVVITGMGMITPLGFTVEETWKNILAGKSGIRPIELFDAETFPTTFASQVPEFDLGKYCEVTEELKLAGRNVRFALAAARMAYDDAGFAADGIDAKRFGIYLGSGEGRPDFFSFTASIINGLVGDDASTVDVPGFAKAAFENFTALKELQQEPNMPTNHVAHMLGLKGPARSCLTACAASTQAIGEAMRIVRRADADIMIAGGTHSMIHPFGVMGFNLLTAISTGPKDDPTKASRPFDRDRAGFVLGEGSSMLILEELEHALAR
ncbi:MAG: beta-ketoacyl-[acyl-carrier-protein] synthase family protein, partial [Phycisphaerae bacterium]|nr:beta-ketoacyl-[acyl-carrier-protein] synthase family protein [Phycisphaerae bacterium]